MACTDFSVLSLVDSHCDTYYIILYYITLYAYYYIHIAGGGMRSSPERAFGRIITSFCKSAVHVPFRDSPLTTVLGSSFDNGNNMVHRGQGVGVGVSASVGVGVSVGVGCCRC